MEVKRSRGTRSSPSILTGTGTSTPPAIFKRTFNSCTQIVSQENPTSIQAQRREYSNVPRSNIPSPDILISQESVLDVANFDPDFTNEEAQDSVVTDSALSETVQDQFRGFTYNPANEHLSESVSYPSAI
jgi:hypothetical protein